MRVWCYYKIFKIFQRYSNEDHNKHQMIGDYNINKCERISMDASVK